MAAVRRSARTPAPALREGEIAARFMAGKPLDHIPVVDFHAHLASSSEYYYIPRNTPAEVAGYLDRYGVARMVAFSIAITSDAAASNQVIYDAAAAFPNRFAPLVMLHAAFPQDWKALLDEGRQRGAIGIKLISQYQGVSEADMDWGPAFDYARDLGWTVLHHHWHSPERLAAWAEAFPTLTFVIGHYLFSPEKFAPVVKRCANVYQCTCAAFVLPGATTEAILRLLPAEKVLFGSDALDLDLATAIGPIALAEVPERDKELILGGNAMRLAAEKGWNWTV